MLGGGTATEGMGARPVERGSLDPPCRWPQLWGQLSKPRPLACGVSTDPWCSWCQSGLAGHQLLSKNREVALDLPSSGSHTNDKGCVRGGGLSTGEKTVHSDLCRPRSPVLHIKDGGEQSAESAPSFSSRTPPFLQVRGLVPTGLGLGEGVINCNPQVTCWLCSSCIPPPDLSPRLPPCQWLPFHPPPPRP